MNTTKHQNPPTLQPELFDGKRRKIIAASPIHEIKEKTLLCLTSDYEI